MGATFTADKFWTSLVRREIPYKLNKKPTIHQKNTSSPEDLSDSPIICALALHHRSVGSEPDGTCYAKVFRPLGRNGLLLNGRNKIAYEVDKLREISKKISQWMDSNHLYIMDAPSCPAPKRITVVFTWQPRVQTGFEPVFSQSTTERSTN